MRINETKNMGSIIIISRNKKHCIGSRASIDISQEKADNALWQTYTVHRSALKHPLFSSYPSHLALPGVALGTEATRQHPSALLNPLVF